MNRFTANTTFIPHLYACKFYIIPWSCDCIVFTKGAMWLGHLFYLSLGTNAAKNTLFDPLLSAKAFISKPGKEPNFSKCLKYKQPYHFSLYKIQTKDVLGFDMQPYL